MLKSLPNVGFCGSHRTGKTTLANFAIDHFKYENTFLNHIRNMMENDKSINLKDHMENGCVDFQQMVIADKMNWERDHIDSGFVTDRTTIDNAAYMLARNPTADEGMLRKYILKALCHAKVTYDLIFLVYPHHLPIPKDTIEGADNYGEQMVVHSLCKTLSDFEYNESSFIRSEPSFIRSEPSFIIHSCYNLPVFEVMGTLEERKEFVASEIQYWIDYKEMM